MIAGKVVAELSAFLLQTRMPKTNYDEFTRLKE